MTCRLLVGDVFDRMRELEDHSFDLIITSPPFLALRSYLPDNHPDKAKEIGSESTPAEYLDVLLRLTAEWRRLLAPHGSIAIELGDTYAGSGGGGGDYLEGGWRENEPGFRGSAKTAREGNAAHWRLKNQNKAGWPLDKSLTGIPTLYTWSLAYGRNLLRQPLTARELLTEAERLAAAIPSLGVPDLLNHLQAFLYQHECQDRGPGVEIEPWRIRNLKPWIRSNPPVGALGDKERPATSYITVACTGRDRWFDLDAVRTASTARPQRFFSHSYRTDGREPGSDARPPETEPTIRCDPGGAPPLDWYHTIDAIIDHEIDTRSHAAGRDYDEHCTCNEHDHRGGAGRCAFCHCDLGNPVPPCNSTDILGDDNVMRSCSLPRGHLGSCHHEPDLPSGRQIDAVIDAEINARAGKTNRHGGNTDRVGIKESDPQRGGQWSTFTGRYDDNQSSVGARGVHIRRALEKAGILTTLDALDVSPRGYAGAHYAVWPKELVQLLVDEMCPRKVCTQCGVPSRRIVGSAAQMGQQPELAAHLRERRLAAGLTMKQVNDWFPGKSNWSGHWEDTTSQPLLPTPEQWAILRERLDLSPGFDSVIVPRSTIQYISDAGELTPDERRTAYDRGGVPENGSRVKAQRKAPSGWSDCGHNSWRPGRILDPFVGSGTTLAVASGMGRDSVGIDLDERNAHFAAERVGMFLDIDWGTQEVTA